jgi:4-hydroxy-3-methylbut-2-enyl diphosphate reductase
MQITLANPRGFCAGVDRAIEIVERALKLFGTPVYVRHEVVHNKYVVDTLRDKGAVFVNELDEVPDESVVIFSAHGVSKAVREEAARRKLRVFDAICPLVTKVHMEVGRYQDEGRECILIGHAGHPEVEGTLGQYRPRNGGAMYLVESVEDVEKMEVKKTGISCVRHTDHPVRGRYLGSDRCLAPALSENRRAQKKRISVTPHKTVRTRSRN